MREMSSFFVEKDLYVIRLKYSLLSQTAPNEHPVHRHISYC
jgi:hypothetical protein